MSFGDLKVQDLIYEDASNNEITVVIADLATKANPTFTGTVTVPTATAGDNSTKAASTAFVVASFAPKASPTFTGTINGADLVLSGNLTVNGTTTTINTQTLDVEDKNVVIGKVSSPSDTTADGGGLTLLGATNKTWNWVNATDAWTSSEHIHLGDDKKLLIGTGSDLQLYHNGSTSFLTDGIGDLRIRGDAVKIQSASGENSARLIANGAVELYYDNSKKFETSSTGVTVNGSALVGGNVELNSDAYLKIGASNDLQIFHDGSNSFIEQTGTGNLVIKDNTGSGGVRIFSNDFQIKNQADNEDIAKFIENGAVELYHNNVKKFETTSAGINVTGSIQVNGAALSSAPTITATASGAISSNDAIIVKSDGNVEKVTETVTANSAPPNRTSVIVNQNQLMNWKVVHCAGTDMVVALYNYESNNGLNYRVGKISGTGTVTWTPSGLQGHTALSSIWSGQQNTEAFAMAWDESEQKLLIVTGQQYSPHVARARLFTVDSSNSTLSASSSSINVRSGSWTIIDNGISLKYIGDRKYICTYIGGGTERYVKAKIIESNSAGTTLTTGSEASFTTSTANEDRVNYACLGDKDAAGDIPCVYTRWGSGGSNAANLYGRAMTVSGTTITVGSEVGPINGTADGGITTEVGVNGIAPQVSYDEDNDVYFTCYRANNAGSNKFYGRAFKATGTTFATVWSQIQLGNNTPSSLMASTYDPIYNKHICYVNDNYGVLKYFVVTTTTTGSSASSEVNATEGDRNGNLGSFPFIGALTYNADFNRHFQVGTLNGGQSYSLFMGPYATSSTNLTAENFIGFSSNGYSNGATATINIVGNTTTKSGLTPGEKYYVQKNGAVKTSAASPSVVAGTAISSTKLLIKPA